MAKTSENSKKKVTKSKDHGRHATRAKSGGQHATRAKSGGQRATQASTRAKTSKIEEAIRIAIKFHKDALKDLERF